MEKIIFPPEFVTATIYEWHSLLKKEEFKQIIIDSLQFLVKEDRIILYAYCPDSYRDGYTHPDRYWFVIYIFVLRETSTRAKRGGMPTLVEYNK